MIFFAQGILTTDCFLADVTHLRLAPKAPQALTIKGASKQTVTTVVEVSGLLSGTTPEDVSTILSHCGRVLRKNFSAASTVEKPVVRLTYENYASAEKAVQTFHGLMADGNMIGVEIVEMSVNKIEERPLEGAGETREKLKRLHPF
jgi:hypothetical protein